jgi:hypothetical protein
MKEQCVKDKVRCGTKMKMNGISLTLRSDESDNKIKSSHQIGYSMMIIIKNSL